MAPVVIVLLSVLIVTIALSPILGAESRPDFLRPDRKSRFRMVGSMRREDWDRREREI
jgi:hypothetical protein